MMTKNKSFDCVEMKNRIQADIQAEYEARREEFSSFVEFVKASSSNSDYARAMHRKFGGSTAAAASCSSR